MNTNITIHLYIYIYTLVYTCIYIYIYIYYFLYHCASSLSLSYYAHVSHALRGRCGRCGSPLRATQEGRRSLPWHDLPQHATLRTPPHATIRCCAQRNSGSLRRQLVEPFAPTHQHKLEPHATCFNGAPRY